MTASPKTVVRFKRAMLSYGLKGLETLMDIRNKISNELKTNVLITGVKSGIITNIIWTIISAFAVFSNPFDCETGDMQSYSSSSSSTWEIVEVSTFEREVFRSEEVIRGESRYTYRERSSYIQVERQIRCVSVRNSADGFHPDETFLCEEGFLEHWYLNGDSSDRFSGFGR